MKKERKGGIRCSSLSICKKYDNNIVCILSPRFEILSRFIFSYIEGERKIISRFNKLLKLEKSERRTIIIQARSNSGSKRTMPLENRL